LVAVRPGRRRFALVEAQEGPERLGVRIDLGDATGTVEVTVVGEVDFGTVPWLEAELAPVAARAETLRIRLAGVTFFDAAGAGALVHCTRVCRARDARLVLVEPAAPVRRILDVTGLSRILDIES
jgi:anti-anti-sigma factor